MSGQMMSQLLGDELERLMMKVICIHGIGGFSSGFKDILRYLGKKKPVEPVFFDYPEKFGTAPLMHLAGRLAELIAREKPEALICLSQGGIIGALALEEFGGSEYCKKCITICTPFNGTRIAEKIKPDVAARVNLVAAIELRPGSRLLTELSEKMRTSTVKYYAVWNPKDLVVVPGSSAKCDFAKRCLEVKSPLHNTTWHEKETLDFVKDALEDI